MEPNEHSPSEVAYVARGLPITPSIMASIVRETFASGELVRRQELLDRVLDYHNNHGGVSASVDPVSQIKKALADLSGSGDIEKTGVYGVWRILGSTNVKNDGVSISTPSDLELTEPAPEDQFEVLNRGGTGSGSVYIYYFPAYWRDEGPFPMKIGMSTGSEQRRIAEQIGTGHPELPIIYRVVRTDTPRLVERYLHSVLTLRDRHMIEAPGSEWFNTTPVEIDEILSFANLPLE